MSKTLIPQAPTDRQVSPDFKQDSSDFELADIKRKSVAGAVSYFGRTVFLQFIGLASIFVLSAYFSPEDFGVYGFVIQIIGILIFFSDIGLAAALIQTKNKPSRTDYKTAFTVQQLLAWAIMGVVVAIIATGFVERFVGRAGVWVLVSLGLSFPLATLKTIPSVMLERKLEFSKLVIPQIFEQIMFHGLLIVLAVAGYGAIAYAYAVLARSLIGVIVMFIIQPWRIGLALSRHSLRKLLGFGIKFQLNDFLARVKDQLFYLALGVILPLREFGYIQWAKNWSLYPYNLTVQNVMAITFPTFSRLQNRPQALKRAIEKSLFFVTAAIFPILIGMCIFIIPLLHLVPAYRQWLPAGLSLIFFSLSIGWSALSTPLTNTLNAIGKINVTLNLMIFWTVLTWALTPLAIIRWGFEGVALVALLISTTSLLPAWYVKKTIPFDFLEQVWRQLVAGLAMAVIGVIGFPWWQSGFRLFILGILVTGSVYLVTLWLLGRSKLKAELASLGMPVTLAQFSKLIRQIRTANG